MSTNTPPGGQGGQLEQLKKMGPPYPPQGAGLGGQPTKGVDVPISSVLLFLFILSAALNMTIFQINRRRGHKFVLSAVVFGFSMARISANVMRIVWACYPHNVSVAIAANILTNAGVLLLFIVNLIFAQRLLRAYHPHLGWSQPLRFGFRGLYGAVVACLIMVITAGVYSFYTLDMSKLTKIRDVQLFAVTFLATLAFLPIPIVVLALLLPRKEPMDPFGTGSMRTKVILVLFTSTLLALGAGFRAGVAYIKRPADNPAWFHHKAAYYCFNYTIELIVVFSYALSRFDRRFWVPNGSSKPGDYSRGGSAGGAAGSEDKDAVVADEGFRASNEEQRRHQQERDWESRAHNEMEKGLPS
ncbi:family c-likeg-protein-coupled receptor protein [Purpureocillium lavendulum]|uniref:Family c-likeg-protein-coupled receptor protein n=1 Tax=Purpureocillium lavendulum TaxID=1247861 RepID=A0AB34G0P1_9HYPO|nr:family c-likeg-protein-coupled receptor protein [Purpureocillium lavendulum]